MAQFYVSPAQVSALNPITRQRILAQLPDIQRRTRRAKRLRGEADTLREMRDKEYDLGGLAPKAITGLTGNSRASFDPVSRYIPNYSGMGKQLVGAIGGIFGDKAADRAEDEANEARNKEIIESVGQIGQKDLPVGSATENELRAYLGLMGADYKDLGIDDDRTRVHGTKTAKNGDIWVLDNKGDWKNSGIKEKSNYRVMKNDLTGELIQVPTSTVGDSKVATFGGETYTDVTDEAGAGGEAPPPGENIPYTFDPDMAQAPPDVQNVIAADEAGQGNQYVGAPPPGMVPPPPNPTADAMGSAMGMPPAASPAAGAVNVGSAADVAAAKKAAEIDATNAAALPSAQTGALSKAGELDQARINEARKLLPDSENTLQEVEKTAKLLLEHPGLPGILKSDTGDYEAGRWRAHVPDSKAASALMGILMPGSNENDALAVHNQAKGQIFLAAYKTLKGGGQITEIEGTKAEQALARMDRATTEKAYRQAVNDFLDFYRDAVGRMRQTATGQGSAGSIVPSIAPAAPAPAAPPELPPGFIWR